jgi:hypothetical protein
MGAASGGRAVGEHAEGESAIVDCCDSCAKPVEPSPDELPVIVIHSL